MTARQTISSGVSSIRAYIKNNPRTVWPCCGTHPEITVDSTPDGSIPGIKLHCPKCGNATLALGSDHIQALEAALTLWDRKQKARAAV